MDKVHPGLSGDSIVLEDGAEIEVKDGARIRVESGGRILVDGQDVVARGDNAVTYGLVDSFQIVAADLELLPVAGSDDGTDPSFLSPVMGNLLGDEVAGEGNYLAGVIGAYSLTGDQGTVYPKAALLGIIMDGSTDADAIVLAHIDGGDPSSETRAIAAFGVSIFNNHADSGVDYGINLFFDESAVDEFLSDTAKPFNIAKAIERSPHEVCRLEGDGAPVDGVEGTGVGFAGKGSQYTDYTTPALYLNTGTKASPVWKKLALFEDI